MTDRLLWWCYHDTMHGPLDSLALVLISRGPCTMLLSLHRECVMFACLLSFRQWPYARHSKIGHTSRNSGRLLMPEKQNSNVAYWRRLNTAVRTLSKTVHTCRMGRCSFSSWFDVDRYTLTKMCAKNDFYIFFTVTLNFDLLIIDHYTTVH